MSQHRAVEQAIHAADETNTRIAEAANGSDLTDLYTEWREALTALRAAILAYGAARERQGIERAAAVPSTMAAERQAMVDQRRQRFDRDDGLTLQIESEGHTMAGLAKAIRALPVDGADTETQARKEVPAVRPQIGDPPMTRLVPRPDWTPVEFVLAVRAAVWEQGVTPETAANRPTVLALFRPAEEPAPAPAVAPPEPRYPCVRCGMLRTKAEGGTAFTVCDDCWDAPAAPPPAGEPEPTPCDHPVEDCIPAMRGGRGYGTLQCLRCGKLVSSAPTAPPVGEVVAEWMELADRLWVYVFDIDLDVSTLVARRGAARWLEHNLGQPHANALAALRSELSASQREVERLRAQGADLEFDVGRLLMERYARRPPPSGENRERGMRGPNHYNGFGRPHLQGRSNRSPLRRITDVGVPSSGVARM